MCGVVLKFNIVFFYGGIGDYFWLLVFLLWFLISRLYFRRNVGRVLFVEGE